MGGLIEEKVSSLMPSLIKDSLWCSRTSLCQLAFPNDELKHVPGHYNLDALKTAQRIGRGDVKENWEIENIYKAQNVRI
jgi:hypothetical protein